MEVAQFALYLGQGKSIHHFIEPRNFPSLLLVLLSTKYLATDLIVTVLAGFVLYTYGRRIKQKNDTLPRLLWTSYLLRRSLDVWAATSILYSLSRPLLPRSDDMSSHYPKVTTDPTTVLSLDRGATPCALVQFL